MRYLLASALLLAACCHCQDFFFPDQLDAIITRPEENRRYENHNFEPPVQSINDVESPPYYNWQAANKGRNVQGFTEIYPENQKPWQRPQVALQAPRPAFPPSRPTYAARPVLLAAPQLMLNEPSQQGNPFFDQSSTSMDAVLPPKWNDYVLNIISRGVTQFTLDMDRAIERSITSPGENLVFSPVSLTVTLAMVLLASGGRTFDEVAKILGLDSGVDISHHSEIVHQTFGRMIQELDKQHLLDKNAPLCKFAFGIFVENGYPLREQFKAVGEKVYKSDIVNVDFSHRSKDAQRIINNWVSNKTEGKIQDLISDPYPDPLTEVMITSALYFSGEWAQHFYEEGTKRKPFNVEPNEKIDVDFMINIAYYSYYEDRELGVKIIALPYKGEQVSMYVLVPTVQGGTAALKNLKSRLTPEVIDRLIGNMKTQHCFVSLPRMKLSSTLHLQKALSALGLNSLFDPQSADLSILSPGRNGRQQQSGRSASLPIENDGPKPSEFRTPVNNMHNHNLFPSRFGSERSNFYTYNDEKRGYKVEQWSTGYNINYLNSKRSKRQSRLVEQEFVNYLNSQNLPSFGIDDLRNSADLRNPGLHADDVIHKVEMTVNERGTEAAAATGVTFLRTGFEKFDANRPFLFFIRHDPTKVIWFWGSINRPTPFYTSM